MKKIAVYLGLQAKTVHILQIFLLKKNYEVHGVKRKSSSLNTSRVDHIYDDKKVKSFFFYIMEI